MLGELTGLLFLATVVSLAGAAVKAASLYGARWEISELIKVAQVLASYMVGAWLTWLVLRQPAPHGAWPWWRPLRGPAAGVLAVAISCLSMPVAGSLNQKVGPALFACAVAWLAVEICRSHGLHLGSRAPYTPLQQFQRWNVAEANLIACAATGLLFGPLGALLSQIAPDAAPILQESQTAALGLDGPVNLALGIVRTVAIEDVVVVAATITLMTAVRRPTWEIYTLVCLIEVGLHAYFGLSAIAAVIMAAGRVWLYLRCPSLLPLMASHALWNIFPEIGQLPLPYQLMAGVAIAASYAYISNRLRKSALEYTPDTPARSALVTEKSP
ncbi:hypothetical protein ACFYXC_39865 [Streptomyces sp. NPDC002701]|uniref:hypothetical protein n=1 Tax=Streptomyces sp. NPDC002701 TaxID=3364661 RepID=UPI0036AF9CBD